MLNFLVSLMILAAPGLRITINDRPNNPHRSWWYQIREENITEKNY